jgi:hypothetical protein
VAGRISIRDHFEGTEFEMTSGLEAGPYGCPYRWKPLGWKLEGDTATEYYWERPISTQQTAFSFVSQLRSSLPDEIGGVFWYSVDDTYSNVSCRCIVQFQDRQIVHNPQHCRFLARVRVFGCSISLPPCLYEVFIHKQWTFSQCRPNRKQFLSYQAQWKKPPAELLATNKAAAIDFLTDYSVARRK